MPETTPSTPVTLVNSPEGNPNLLNFSVGVDGIYDNNTEGGYEGGDVNWGAIANHHFEGGSLSLSYRGDYRDFAGPQAYRGTDQNLSFALSKALSRRWLVTFSQAGGIFQYGASYFSLQPVESNIVETNPYDSKTDFLSSGFSATYQKSLRWSYTLSFNYFLSRYSGLSPYGISAITTSAAASYRLTPLTTLSGTYAFSDYRYQNQGGQTQVHTAYATLSHQFRNRWSVLGSAGATRSQSAGIIDLALSPGLAQLLGSTYLSGAYNTTTYLPYFQGSLSRSLRHARFSLTGGQSVTPGNGIYLASKALNVNGFFSYTWHLSSLGFGGAYTHFGSVANAAQSYDATSFSASYGYPLARHMALSLRYDFVDYSGTPFSSVATDRDNRVTVGVVFNSKTVPITLF
ncbi:MAG: hypothetical protein WA324_03890 [Bryobacteraceae bacterium]